MLLLSTLAAVGYGVSDFAGGLAARRQPGPGGLLRSQAIGLVLLFMALPFDAGTLSASGVGLSLAAGICGMAGLYLTYRLMRHHPISVVAPFTAVLAAGIPIAAGTLGGEHITATAAIGALTGLVAIALVAPATGTKAVGLRTANRWTVAMMLTAGGCFGGFFVLIAQAGAEQSGLVPLIVARTAAVAVAIVATITKKAGAPWKAATGLLFLFAGTSDAAADVCFLLASRHGHLSISGVITALYPVVTVLLAVTLLRERISPKLGCGLGLSALTLALIAW